MPGGSALGAAVSFLTRVPTGRRVAYDGAAVARSAPLFPLVGAAVGAAGGAAAGAASVALPSLAAAALGLGVVALLTGAMHLDALADTADALGGWSRERRLEIMRDHAIGSFGAVALVVVLLVEASLVAALVDEGDAWRSLAAAGACSRLAPLPLAAALPYARPDGQGAALAVGTSWVAASAGGAVAAVLAVALAGAAGAFALVAALLVAAGLGAFFRSWLGGVTGDTLGASVELAQVAALAVLVAA